MLGHRVLACGLASLFVFGCGPCQKEAKEPAPAPALSVSASPPPASPASAPPPASPTPSAISRPSAAPAAGTPPTGFATLGVRIEPRSGSTLKGTLDLATQSGGVAVTIEVEGAQPGRHGVHFHENADCSAPDATSAGPHWNPDRHQHGLPPVKPRHLGDMGNLEVGANGKGRMQFFLDSANLIPGDPHSLVGRGLIVHEKRDDGSQPFGSAGGRLGCAEIKG
jgi:superoxide dismutase, Cu-Zn family